MDGASAYSVSTGVSMEPLTMEELDREIARLEQAARRCAFSIFTMQPQTYDKKQDYLAHLRWRIPNHIQRETPEVTPAALIHSEDLLSSNFSAPGRITLGSAVGSSWGVHLTSPSPKDPQPRTQREPKYRQERLFRQRQWSQLDTR
ncbi:hypothetical protein CBOM_05711 [Ceraceosorus bombacis]|uniref:Uncharacterized protein n=1 Tax=Ceraceosorus bombacis TaxID=401625 RepID=A0A0N7LBC8_9BASI|nr:hypothetical protein CBOM_05711 [Ceraceosorus bombacis]